MHGTFLFVVKSVVYFMARRVADTATAGLIRDLAEPVERVQHVLDL